MSVLFPKVFRAVKHALFINFPFYALFEVALTARAEVLTLHFVMLTSEGEHIVVRKFATNEPIKMSVSFKDDSSSLENKNMDYIYATVSNWVYRIEKQCRIASNRK